jgi:predicted  nucleic acid-binding Zn-ribbon protein
MPEDYCLKCKKKTKDIKPHQEKTKNNRVARVSTCAICGSKKFAFVSSQKGGNAIAAMEAVNEIGKTANDLTNSFGDQIDKGRRTTRELDRESGKLEIDKAQNKAKKAKTFNQYYRDLMHLRFWDADQFPPSLRFPREKTNNPKYKKEQDIADQKLWDYAEKTYNQE